jgi:hypothetical protein
MTRRLTSALLVVAFALFVAGCGGGAAETPGTSAAPAPTDPSTSQTVGTTTPTPGAIDPTTGQPVTGGTGEVGIPMTSASAGDLPTISGASTDVFVDNFKLDSGYDMQTGSTDESGPTITGATIPNGQGSDDCKEVEPTITYTSATVTLDGASYTVKKGSVFPKDTQQFTVTSISADSAVVNLTAGEFSDGSDGLTLTKGDPVSLVNQSEGITYTLELTKVVGKKSETSSGTDAVC